MFHFILLVEEIGLYGVFKELFIKVLARFIFILLKNWIDHLVSNMKLPIKMNF